MARIVLTRPAGQERELAERLAELGHEVVSCPLIRIEPLADDPIDASAYEWLVVTSRNGASEVARRLTGRPRRIAAIGPGTAQALRAGGLDVDLVASESTQEGLLAELSAPSGRVLVAAAEAARRHAVAELGADFVPLYRTVALQPVDPPAGDLVVLASASAARAFGALGVEIPAVSIGPQTTNAARELGVTVVAEASRHDLDGLVEAVAAAAR